MGSRLTECPCGCTYVTALYKTCPGDYHDNMVRVALRTLAANLAVGGALCASWTRGHNVGFDVGWDDASGRHGGNPSDKWRPGCGRAWGGGE